MIRRCPNCNRRVRTKQGDLKNHLLPGSGRWSKTEYGEIVIVRDLCKKGD